jgi:hypothetical protein
MARICSRIKAANGVMKMEVVGVSSEPRRWIRAVASAFISKQHEAFAKIITLSLIKRRFGNMSEGMHKDICCSQHGY